MRNQNEHEDAGLEPAPFDSSTALVPAEGRALDDVHAPFSYDELSPDQADDTREDEEAILASQRSMTCEALAVGSRLIRAKARLAHGQFARWCRDRVYVNPKTAQQLMKSAEVFGSNAKRVSHLTLGVVYDLAYAPEAIREELLRHHEETGAPITRGMIQEAV